MSKLDETIDRFISHFRGQSARIASLGAERDHNLFKKSLYVAVLDALARSVYPQKGNRDRFVAFIREFGSWKEADRVSLPHLATLLSKVPDPAFSQVRQYALAEIAKWSEGQMVTLSRDPSYDTIRKLWPQDKDGRFPLAQISLESLQHVHLLYAFRNSLVHELRQLGYGVEREQDKEPYYMSCTSLGPGIDAADSGEKTWELTYPVTFFETLCACTLLRLEKYLKKDRLDPYASYRFGTYWISGLN